MATIDWTSSTVTVAGNELHLRRAGRVKPLLLLHRDIGTLDSLLFYDLLAQSHDVLIPDHPGYGRSPRAEWIGHVRDIAALYRAMLGGLGLKDAALVGLPRAVFLLRRAPAAIVRRNAQWLREEAAIELGLDPAAALAGHQEPEDVVALRHQRAPSSSSRCPAAASPESPPREG